MILLSLGGDDMKNKIFVSGYARLPHGITASELYTVMCVGLLINTKTHIIEKAECSLVTELAKNFFEEIVTGKNINDIDIIIEELNESYYGSAKKSLISCLKLCNEKYKMIKVF